MKRKNLPFLIRISLLPFLGPILIAGWSLLKGFGIHVIGGLLGCPFPIPFIMCHVCPAICAFGVIRSWLIGGITLTSILFGRIFCGLICPFGTIQDIFHRISPKNIEVNRIDKLLRYLKYGTLLLFAGLVIELTHIWLKIPFMDNLLLFIITHDEIVFVAVSIFAVSILTLSFFVSRPWCRYLCPFGALISISNKMSTFYIEREEKKCIECGICEEKCLTGLNLINREDATSSIECIRCFECYAICKRNAFKLRTRIRRG